MHPLFTHWGHCVICHGLTLRLIYEEYKVIYFVKGLKLSTGPITNPYNTKSGAAMVKCMHVQGMMA